MLQLVNSFMARLNGKRAKEVEEDETWEKDEDFSV
jgi:hypothetical protein